MLIIDRATGEYIEDGSYEADWLAIPTDLTLPAPLKKLAKEYESAWANWSDQVAELETAGAAFSNSEAADTLALTEAVKAGKPNPGHPNKDAANETYRYQAEVTRQAATRANELRDKVIASVREHRLELIADAVRLERETIQRTSDSYAKARAIADAAEREVAAIGERINWVTTLTDPTTAIHRRVNPYLPVIRWPEPHEFDHQTAVSVLDLIEAEANPQLTTGNVNPNRLNSFAVG